MALSDDTKNDLKGMVATIRERLTNEFTEQLQELYGIQPEGEIADVEDLGLVDEEQRTVAEQLRESIEHYVGGPDASQQEKKEAIQRTIREQAFTVLNRFAALRLAEERDLVSESVGSGFDSAGFRVYGRVAGSSLGETTYDRYRVYLECLFDELALDLGVLFDRYAPEGLLFPREEALEDVLDALNREDVEDAWTEDETIGWIYQYFHPKSERKGMRDESSTPRNSREMAVRNQLFTPRYVVEFLVDNSLGRYWHEMTEGETDLTDDLDYFVPRENELFLGEDEDPPEDPDEDLYVAPYRDLKDPREIRLLDPACGSMHFGLYAFDLFEQIYAEAWDRYPDFRASLQEDLELEEGDREAFLREVPRLIVEHNLYGIDIDRRAAQIAGLALWLRAQRAWSERDVDSTDRPRIRQSGIVCAEPMPGAEDLINEYVEELEREGPEGKLLGDLVQTVWDRMQIAGEAGPLLKVEREIGEILEEARRQFEELRREGKQASIFGEHEQGELQFDVAGVEENFFDRAEARLLDVLRRFAIEGTEGSDYSRRLFADDAERGFAFLELTQIGKVDGFDVVVMNPPFGAVSEDVGDYLDDHYPDTKNDVYQAFVERAEEVLRPTGYLGAITNRTGFFLSDYQSFRERVVLERFRPHCFADFGYGVLDATVGTAAYTMRTLSENERYAKVCRLLDDLVNVETTGKGKFSVPKYMRGRSEDLERRVAEEELEQLEKYSFIRDASGRYTQYVHRNERIRESRSDLSHNDRQSFLKCFRLIDLEDRSQVLRGIVRNGDSNRQFSVFPPSFYNVPYTTFSYWVSENVRGLFREVSSLEESGRSIEHGLSTKNDFRYLRCWWEVPANKICPPQAHEHEWKGRYCVLNFQWYPLAKGASFNPLYSDEHIVVNWKNHGRELEADLLQKYSYLENNAEFVLHRECSYYHPGLTFSRRARLFSTKPVSKGMLFSDNGLIVLADEEDLGWISAYLSSDVMRSILGLIAPPRKNEMGYVSKLPVPTDIEKSVSRKLSEARGTGVEQTQTLAARDEVMLDFRVPSSLSPEENVGIIDYPAEEINDAVADILDLDEKEKRNLLRQLGTVTGLNADKRRFGDIDDTDEDIEGDGSGQDSILQLYKSDSKRWHESLSYAVGVAFGRFEIRYATGDHEIPDLSDPFDPLPVRPAGMLTDEDGIPLEEEPDGYPLSFPSDGIIPEHESLPHTLVDRVRSTLELVHGEEEAVQVEQKILDAVGRDTLEEYLRNPNGFFDDHKSKYSKSRRRAPIYWPLQTPSQQYTLWVYYPRLDGQTLYTCINDHISPKLENDVRPRIERIRKKVQSSGNSEAREALDRLETLEQELEEMREELLRVAELPYEPNQNDGVELTAAPLHNLFQHTGWSDRLEDYWEELQDGEYDWAHIAYSIWPDRVEDACRENKSIAIAHDREDLYEGDS
ncbi:Eco57I restriction-modification methylase domain-containing protein [Salinibacter ruber]|uniref:Eco57I restriction-modification methylase domain-containing protein n=1 Tax=Salinibacter ruber TaxID=146919 RepID=UPI0019688BEA|nr:hypothetical protein [Salinibacter ruber]